MSGNEARESAQHNISSSSSSSRKVNVREIMRELRERIRGDMETHVDQRKTFAPYQAEVDGQDHKAGDLLHSPNLLYLNQHCAQSDHLRADHFKSHRPGIIGKLVTKIKRKIHSKIFLFLDRYISTEREFQSNLVRHLNDTAKYIDARDMQNFWELIRKIDYDVQKALDRIERINDEQMGALRTSEKWVNETVQSNVIAIREDVARHGAEIRTLESVSRGLESIISKLDTPVSNIPQAAETKNGAKESADYSYLLLENRYRGSEEAIAKRLALYPEFFSGSTKSVLEIGSGRGELLSLLKNESIAAYGVDLDPTMVEAAQAQGLKAQCGDGIAYLRTLAENSLSGVIAIQVVEHLTRAQLEELFALCLSRVEPGGRVVFETINPRSLLALSSNYFRDPTHVWPLHPDTLEYTMNLAGLQTVEVKFLSPVEREGQLRELSVEEYMSPRMAHTIQTINRNFEQLNSLIYGFQDYCIVAEVPK